MGPQDFSAPSALIDGGLGTGGERSDLVRMAVQLIVEEVLEGEARDKPA